MRQRGGYDLMPELGDRPVNKYLPPRERRDAPAPAAPPASVSPQSRADRLFARADRLLSR